MKFSKNFARPVVILIVAVTLFLFPTIRVPYIDNKTDSYFTSSIIEASASYAVCRGVNATVSVVKESHVEVEPAGVGVSLAIGQIVDPIYDLTERATDVFVTAIASLTIQEIAYKISVALAPKIVASLLVLILVLSWIKHQRAKIASDMMMKLMILVLLARFCLPVSSIINDFLHERFFAPEIKTAEQAITLNSPELEKLAQIKLPQIDGVIGTIENSADFVKTKSGEFASALGSIYKSSKTISENLVKIISLYVADFIVQVVLLPILVFWGLVKFTNSLFEMNLPYIIRHSELFRRTKTEESKSVN
jgi:hypothetical protein